MEREVFDKEEYSVGPENVESIYSDADAERFLNFLIPPDIDDASQGVATRCDENPGNENAKNKYIKNEKYTAKNRLRTLLTAVIPKPYVITYEDYYVDREFRDSYYLYFSSQYFETNRFCVRLGFFQNDIEHPITYESFLDVRKDKGETKNKSEKKLDELNKKYIGCCVIRPIREVLGKTLLDPAKINIDSDIYIRTATYRMSIHGNIFTIDAFPFSTQDGETTRCAETTILNMLDYYSARYSDYHRILPSEIFNLTKTDEYERQLPSQGLGFEHISKVFSDCGFYPRYYDREKVSYIEQDKLEKLLYSYTESGIPVAIGLNPSINEYHSIICIGHGARNEDKLDNIIENPIKMISQHAPVFISSADFYDSFVVMDDTGLPYQQKTKDLGMISDMLSITAPLQRRINMDASDAESIAKYIINHRILGVADFIADESGYKGHIIYRLFLTTGRNYKNHKMEHCEDTEHAKFWDTLPLPHFVWTCELFFPEDYKNPSPKAFGELVLDSTAGDQNTPSLYSLIYLRYCDKWTYSDVADSYEDRINDLICTWNHSYNLVTKYHTAYKNNLLHVSYSSPQTNKNNVKID